MKYVLIMILVTLGLNTYAQDVQLLSTSDNDPKATKILDAVQEKYEKFAAVEIDFSLTLTFPESEEQVQKGKMIQQDEYLFLDMPDRAIYNNGTAIWVHLKEEKEVQLNDVDSEEDGSLLLPKDIIKIYNSDDYVYTVSEYGTASNAYKTIIDFKPLDRNSEYFKIKLWVTKENNLHQMKLFSKDGSRYTLKINKLVPNKAYSLSRFEFDKSKYPDVYIEDLRID